jgi:hypothetical protein
VIAQWAGCRENSRDRPSGPAVDGSAGGVNDRESKRRPCQNGALGGRRCHSRHDSAKGRLHGDGSESASTHCGCARRDQDDSDGEDNTASRSIGCVPCDEHEVSTSEVRLIWDKSDVYPLVHRRVVERRRTVVLMGNHKITRKGESSVLYKTFVFQ